MCVYIPLPPSLSGKPVVNNVQSLRLCADDFDTIELIGKGAFGEVKVQYCSVVQVLFVCLEYIQYYSMIIIVKLVL